MDKQCIGGTDTAGYELRTGQTIIHIIMTENEGDSGLDPSMPFPPVNLLLPLEAAKTLRTLLEKAIKEVDKAEK